MSPGKYVIFVWVVDFFFAMCSGTETLEVALAADGVDICESLYDGDGMDPDAQSKLNFTKTLAFQNFRLGDNYGFSYSDINVNSGRGYGGLIDDYFTLFSFSAKWDPVPTMLTQDHDFVIKSFSGLTTAFKKSLLKPSVLLMGEDKKAGTARYIHGEFGKGQWTYYSGHDPEGQQGGRGGGGPGQTRDLSLTPSSPGYRLILNNVLFPSAKKKKQKT